VFKEARVPTFRAFEGFDFEGNKDYQAGLQVMVKSLVLGVTPLLDPEAEKTRQAKLLDSKIFFYSKYVAFLLGDSSGPCPCSPLGRPLRTVLC